MSWKPLLLSLFLTFSLTTATWYTVYDDQMRFTDWDGSWSWGGPSYNFGYTGAEKCGSASIQVTMNSNMGFALHGPGSVTIPSWATHFQFNVWTSGSTDISINIHDPSDVSYFNPSGDKSLMAYNGGQPFSGGKWILVSVPFSDLGISSGTTLNVFKMYWRVSSSSSVTIYLDEILFTDTAEGNGACFGTSSSGTNSGTTSSSSSSSGTTYTGIPSGPRLQIVDNQFKYNGSRIYLSGCNIAWSKNENYGQEFGTGKNIPSIWNPIFQSLSSAGANSIRQWVHFDARSSPLRNGNTVTGLPSGFIQDLIDFLNLAMQYNILVNLCLWNHDMVFDENFMSNPSSYVNNALTPIVNAVKGHPAIAAWEIINEPEGMSTNWGWTGNGRYSMQTIQKFVNIQAHAIHTLDPEALVTVGSWSFLTLTVVSGYSNTQNYYSNSALLGINNNAYPKGYLDFYQVHWYAQQNGYPQPFSNPCSTWGLDKPLVIGEFSSADGGGMTIQQMTSYAYNNGYAGAWIWQWSGGHQSDSQSTLLAGITNVKTQPFVPFQFVVYASTNGTNGGDDDNNNNMATPANYVSELLLLLLSSSALLMH